MAGLINVLHVTGCLVDTLILIVVCGGGSGYSLW